MERDVEPGHAQRADGRVGRHQLPVPRLIGNLPVHPVRLDSLLRWMDEAVTCHARVTVFYANAHAVNLARADAGFRAAYSSADVVFCDGQGVRLGAALLGLPLPERFTPPDWIDELISLPGIRSGGLFLLGGRPEVNTAALRSLHERHPGLRAAGHHGYFLGDPHEEQAVIDLIRGFGPAVVLVGLGMPLQEYWVAAHRDDVGADVVMTVGALTDYLAGAVPRGPRWLTDHGLEWLCRLWFEPQRLWRRYLLGNPAFLLSIVRQMVADRAARSLVEDMRHGADSHGRWNVGAAVRRAGQQGTGAQGRAGLSRSPDDP
jgi:N-acetylglucosaminyldiphosphoundecaprenol N-acetyl-beta-D-mannosaminyltransferase